MYILLYHKWFFLEKLPFSIRVLLESAVRNCDGFQVHPHDVQNILSWKENQQKGDVEVQFKPARVILQVKHGVLMLKVYNTQWLVLLNFDLTLSIKIN